MIADEREGDDCEDAQDGVNQEESEQHEVDGMKKEADESEPPILYLNHVMLLILG